MQVSVPLSGLAGNWTLVYLSYSRYQTPHFCLRCCCHWELGTKEVDGGTSSSWQHGYGSQTTFSAVVCLLLHDSSLCISVWVSIFILFYVSIDMFFVLFLFGAFFCMWGYLLVWWCWQQNSKPHAWSITELYPQEGFLLNKFLGMTDSLVIISSLFDIGCLFFSLYFVHIFSSCFTHFNDTSCDY